MHTDAPKSFLWSHVSSNPSVVVVGNASNPRSSGGSDQPVIPRVLPGELLDSSFFVPRLVRCLASRKTSVPVGDCSQHCVVPRSCSRSLGCLASRKTGVLVGDCTQQCVIPRPSFLVARRLFTVQSASKIVLSNSSFLAHRLPFLRVFLAIFSTRSSLLVLNLV